MALQKISTLIGLSLIFLKLLLVLYELNTANFDVNFNSHDTLLRHNSELRSKLAAVERLLKADNPSVPQTKPAASNGRIRGLEGIASLPCMACNATEALLTEYGKGEGRLTSDYIRSVYLELVKYTVSGYGLKTKKHNTAIFDDTFRYSGKDWPEFGFAMTGIHRLTVAQKAIEQVLRDNIAGDFMECGVWRGGTSIMARATLLAHGNNDKIVYVSDSFRGLPNPRISIGEQLAKHSYLSVSVERVKSHFQRMYVYDPEKVKFIVGFFNESMPAARQHIKVLSVLRLDGDLYESCFDVLNNMYDKLSIGGYVLIDDWSGFSCQTAVVHFKKAVNSTEPINATRAQQGASWRKTIAVNYDPEVLYQKLIVPRLLNNKSQDATKSVAFNMPNNEDILEYPCRGCNDAKEVLKSYDDDQEGYVRALFVETLKAAVGGYSLQTTSFENTKDAKKTTVEFNDEYRYKGSHLPAVGLTTMGLSALDALHHLLSHVINAEVMGDFLDVGVGQGGTAILAASVFKARFQPFRSILMVDRFNFTSVNQADRTLTLLKDSLRRFFVYPEDNVFLISVESAAQEAQLFDNELSAIRIDVCAFDSALTSAVLAKAYDRLSSGGLVILDNWRYSDDANYCADGSSAVATFKENAAAGAELKGTPHPWVWYWMKP